MADDPTVCEVCWKNPCACPPRTEYRWYPGARGGAGDYKPVIEPGVAAIISKPLAYGAHNMRGSKIDIAARTKKIAAELRLDINTERHYNDSHPEDPSRVFEGLDPDLPDAELLAQLMAQEESRRKS